MTWLDLYNFLHDKANDINNLDQKIWQSKVFVHDAITGEENVCEVYEVTTNDSDQHTCLVYNEKDWGHG
jgi:hypothetical protein|tara:strand:+ start:384 stop:590 length:207 start_codon:yes stop_codon:yes gene_type:complete